MVECEYLKLLISNCKNDYKLNSRRSLWVKICSKSNQIESLLLLVL